MKVILFSRADTAHRLEELRRVVESIRSQGFDFSVNREFLPMWAKAMEVAPEQIDCYDEVSEEFPDRCVMVCLGGDGTLLEGARRLKGAPIPVVGINSGRLGFLTGVKKEDVETLFAEIARGDLRIEKRSMLEIEGDLYAGDLGNKSVALNEISIQRRGAGMISVEAYVDEQMVATYHGDGVLLSTPTGSTAYSLSAGGPVVSPQCACFVLTPLAPHNLTMRPVVIPDSSRVRFRVHTREEGALLSLDNRTYNLAEGAELRIVRSSQSIFLAIPYTISFYDTLREKLLWGVDVRS